MDMFRKKTRKVAKASVVSKPTNVGTSTMMHDDEYIPNTNNSTQQHARYPNTFPSDTDHSSTPGHSTSHGYPNPAPQDPSRPVSNHPHQLSQANQAPPRAAHPQQRAMNTSMAGQYSATGRLTSQDRTHPTERSSGSPNPSRPSSAHSRTSSANAPPNNTAATSQRNSGASTDSRYSSASSSNQDPFYLEKYRPLLK